eukprot:scaffold6013_cov210-Isochrysis_galbana.AAC.7
MDVVAANLVPPSSPGASCPAGLVSGGLPACVGGRHLSAARLWLFRPSALGRSSAARAVPVPAGTRHGRGGLHTGGRGRSPGGRAGGVAAGLCGTHPLPQDGLGELRVATAGARPLGSPLALPLHRGPARRARCIGRTLVG